MHLDHVNRAEIWRYLGAKGKVSPDAEMSALVEDCLEELDKKAEPKHVFRTWPLSLIMPGEEEGLPVLDFSCFQVQSKDLARNLTGCTEVLLFAATIGSGIDLLIRRYEKTNMVRASVCQAASAAMIESYCNEINDAWKDEYLAKGCKLRPRFSCGYGDFKLEHQKDFLRVLDMEKRLGIRLTEGLLMVPTKSVTAVIGIAKDDAKESRP